MKLKNMELPIIIFNVIAILPIVMYAGTWFTQWAWNYVLPPEFAINMNQAFIVWLVWLSIFNPSK